MSILTKIIQNDDLVKIEASMGFLTGAQSVSSTQAMTFAVIMIESPLDID